MIFFQGEYQHIAVGQMTFLLAESNTVSFPTHENIFDKAEMNVWRYKSIVGVNAKVYGLNQQNTFLDTETFCQIASGFIWAK